jgi:nitronate monooxygenase
MPADVRSLFRRPLVVAPMGGGPSTPALVIAAAEAGGIGMLAGGYKTASAMAAEMAAVWAATQEPFGVNLFVPGRPAADAGELADFLRSLVPDADAVGGVCGAAAWDDDHFEDKVATVLTAPPPLVSFTFGCPGPEVVAAVQSAGSVVAVTVTSPEEAVRATAAGADALCVQGIEAGAHRGTFVNADRPGQDYGLLALICEVARVTDAPQLAAGGIVHRRQVQAVLAAGAVAAQCGTAFLRCPESGAHPVHKAALVDPRFTATALTRAFTGRPARGLVNRFVLEHSGAPAAYPEINNATRPIRAAAAERSDADRMSLWAGQGFRSATDRPAGEVIEWLCSTPRPL